jgi:retinol dehydrogenase-12
MMHCLITGGSSGLGLEATKELCKLGYQCTITARSHDRGKAAVGVILESIPEANVEYLILDLEDLESVRQCGDSYLSSSGPLHLLINNAGTFTMEFTSVGNNLESHFHVNHLSHFLLTHMLLPRMLSSGGGKVINVSSRAHLRWKAALDFDLFTLIGKDRFDPGIAYGLSKLCNILFTKALATRFPADSTGISFYSLTPGLVDTKILDPIPQFKSSAVSVSEGVKTYLHIALKSPEELEAASGSYFVDCRPVVDETDISSIAQSSEEAERLWQYSLTLTNLTDESYGRSG